MSAGQREVFAPPRSYAAQIDSYGRFGTIYLSNLPLKMEPKRLLRNVVTNYQSTLRNVPEERRYNSRVGRRVVERSAYTTFPLHLFRKERDIVFLVNVS